MGITKVYHKRLALVALVPLCLLLSYGSMVFRHISDESIDSVSMRLHQQSEYDPRAITYTVLQYLESLKKPRTGPTPLGDASGIYFHWDDWVDLSPGNSQLRKRRSAHSDGSCDASLVAYASVNPYWMESFNTKVYRGMANLYCIKDLPRRVLVATNEGYLNIPVVGRKRLGTDNMPPVSMDGMKSIVDNLSVRQLVPSAVTRLPYAMPRKSVNVAPKDFVFNIDKEIFKLKEKLNQALSRREVLSESDVDHLRFLEAANNMVDSSDRFFKYPWIYTDVVAGRSHHLSFPFFKRFISSRERQSVIQHMVRAWFTFAEAAGVDTWINYGNLLGWEFNGNNLPWDTDVDVQIPIAQLDELSRRFNGTLVMEHPDDGNAKYLFEVSPTYVRQGNGRNFIDARFIEINSGLYIDISVLSHTGDQPPSQLTEGLSDEDKLKAIPVHCKNWNWHLLDELLPIRHTFFEGSSVYIPHNVSSIIHRKWPRLSFPGHHFDEELMLWIPDDEKAANCKLTAPGKMSDQCQSPYLSDEYNILHEATSVHKKLNGNVDQAADYDIGDYNRIPLTRKDPWQYFEDLRLGATKNTEWYVGETKQ